MKTAILVMLISFAGMAVADQVKIQTVIALSVCTMDAHGEIVKCNASNDPAPIRETLAGELDHTDCGADCFNDGIEFNKSYTIADPVSGETFPLEVNVSFWRESEILAPKTPFFIVSAHIKPAGGSIEDDHMAMTSVKDIANFRNLFLPSKPKRIPQPDGNVLELIPRLDIVGIDIVN